MFESKGLHCISISLNAVLAADGWPGLHCHQAFSYCSSLQISYHNSCGNFIGCPSKQLLSVGPSN